jgi:hypothetical protein
MSRLTPRELLSLWEACHGELNQEWKNQFLEKPQVTKILQYPQDSIIVVVRKNIKLSDILAMLEAREKILVKAKSTSRKNLNKAKPNKVRNVKKSSSKNLSSKKIQTSAKAERSRGKQARFDEVHPSEYGSTTVRKPGRAESILPGREQCPSCGMLVTGNNMKCRCS